MNLKPGVYTPHLYCPADKSSKLQSIFINCRCIVKCCQEDDGWWFCTSDIWYILRIHSEEERHKLNSFLRMSCYSYRFNFKNKHMVMAQPKDFTKIKRVRNAMRYWGISFANGKITITPVEHERKDYGNYRRNEQSAGYRPEY